MMSEAARPAAAKAQRCVDDAASEVTTTTSSSFWSASAAVFALAFVAALGIAAPALDADFLEALGSSVGLMPRWLAAEMRMAAGGGEGWGRKGREGKGRVGSFFFPFEKKKSVEKHSLPRIGRERRPQLQRSFVSLSSTLFLFSLSLSLSLLRRRATNI